MGACGVPEETERIEAPIAAVWVDDTFDDLTAGPLDGQGGWASVPGRASAEVQLVDPGDPGPKLVRIEAIGDNPIIMTRDVADQVGGCSTLEFDVKLSEAAAASVAKIEVQTDPRPGEVGKWANKKFQIYVGTSIRVNYGAGGEAAVLVGATEMDRWYHVSASMNVTDEVVSLSVDGSVVTPPLPMGRGPIASLSLSGWDRSDEDADGGSTGIAFFDGVLGQSIEGCETSGRVWCVQQVGVQTGPPCANRFAFGTIQEAIDEASSGDEIRIASGFVGRSYTGTGRAVATIGTNLMLTGGYIGFGAGWANPPARGPNLTGVDGQRVRPAFEIVGTPVVTIRNLQVSSTGIANPAGTIAVHTFPLELVAGSSNGRFSVSSSLDFRGPHTLRDGTTIVGAGAARIFSGPVTVEGSVTARNLELRDGGTLTGPGTITGTHAITWTGGIMGGTGTTVSLLAMSLSGPQFKFHRRTIENRGTATWTGGEIQSSEGAAFNNAAGALFDIQSNAAFAETNAGARPVFNNAGKVRKSAGVGNTDLRITFSGGDVEAQTGTIRLNADGTATGDSHFTVAAGAVIDLNGSARHTYTGSITGAGAGTVRLANGILSIGAAGADFNLPPPLFQWSGGMFTGPGVLTNSGALQMGGGSIKFLDGITIENRGTVTWVDTSSIHARNGATFNNAGGALFDVKDNASFAHDGTGAMAVFNNAGHVHKSAGAGGTVFQLDFNNAGTVQASTGTTSFRGGGFEQTAGTLLLTGGNVSSPLLAINVLGGAVEGVGTITGRLQNGGVIRPGSAAGPGILAVTGIFAQTATGELETEWRGPTPGVDHDQLVVSGAVTLDGSLRLLRFPGFVPVPGDSFAPLRYASRIGEFSNVTNDGVTYDLADGANSVTARVVSVP